MDQKVKWQLVIAIFALCWMIYLLLPSFPAQRDLSQLFEPFSSEPVNLVFLMIIFLAFAVGLTDVSEAAYRQIRRLKWFRPRLGEVLITRGYITKEELETALEEQKLRLGDVLLHSERISEAELEEALKIQKVQPSKRLGALLIELGHCTEKDIQWAYHRINRKLGKILIEQGLITEYDLKRVLGRMWYSRHTGY